MSIRSVICVSLLSLTPLADLSAQELFVKGERLRVTAPTIAEKPIVGLVRSSSPDSITLFVPSDARRAGRLAPESKAEGLEHSIPLSSVRRLEVYEGRSHSPVNGMGKGLLVGAGIGLAIGIGAATEDSSWVCNGGECLFYGTLGGAFWGIVFGGLFGAALGQDHWDDVILVQPRIDMQPNGGGVGVAVSVGL